MDNSLLPAVRAAIRANELGAASPYQLSFACLGQSGASFGIFQGDTNVNHTARGVLRQALVAAGAGDTTCNRIIGAVSQPCPHGNPLSPADTEFANAALASRAGQTLVDGMDATLLQIVVNELNSSIAAATTRGLTIAPASLLYIALWVNMTGAPATLNKWLAGTAELGLPAPAGPIVTRENLEAYLHMSTYFRLHPGDFVHMSDSVDQGLAALPAG